MSKRLKNIGFARLIKLPRISGVTQQRIGIEINKLNINDFVALHKGAEEGWDSIGVRIPLSCIKRLSRQCAARHDDRRDS